MSTDPPRSFQVSGASPQTDLLDDRPLSSEATTVDDSRLAHSKTAVGIVGTVPLQSSVALSTSLGATPEPEPAPEPDPEPVLRTSRGRAVEDPYIGKVMNGRYRVLSKLGEGGMGVVYLGEHVLIEKKVAIKVLSDDFARKPDLVTRFLQEAKAASKIGHENIIDINDFGETESGSVYFVMEFLEGRDLAYHIREGGPMEVHRAAGIVDQICRALYAAHNKGIIHRDLKPENIYLIEREGRADFVKILDFGIAKVSNLDESGGARLTRTGMIFGTPEYMSPEQARGDRPDHRVDIYAVGCILYELLTGDVPFKAESFMGVLTKHMFEPVVPPSQRAPMVAINGRVEEVVLKALAKDRETRFSSMKEFSYALLNATGGEGMAQWSGEHSGMTPVPPAVIKDSSRQQTVSSPAVGAARPVPAGSASDEEPLEPSSTRRWLPSIALGGLVLGVAGALVVNSTRPQAPPVQPPAPVVEQAPPPQPTAASAAPVVPSQPEAPPAPRTSHIKLVSSPAGASVYVGNDLLGTTPHEFDVESGKLPFDAVFKLKGQKDIQRTVDPSENREISVEFAKPPGKRPAGGDGRRPKGGKQGPSDLKNPFSGM